MSDIRHYLCSVEGVRHSTSIFTLLGRYCGYTDTTISVFTKFRIGVTTETRRKLFRLISDIGVLRSILLISQFSHMNYQTNSSEERFLLLAFILVCCEVVVRASHSPWRDSGFESSF